MHQKGDLTCLSKSRQLPSRARSNQKGSSTLIFQEAFQAHLGQDPPTTMASMQPSGQRGRDCFTVGE